MQQRRARETSVLAKLGMPTLHGRVESWECDFNNHWNARFYARSFQLASETLSALPSVTVEGEARPLSRYLRFHRELFVGAAVEVRSVLVSGGSYHGAVVHLLCSGDALSATCLDLGQAQVSGLPEISADKLALALPRGLAGREAAEWQNGANSSLCETGPLRPDQVDHRGDILFEDIIRRVAYATHNHVSAIGLDEKLLKETGISRMAVESRISPLGSCPAGVPLRVRVRISKLAQKSFTVTHMVESHAKAPVAFVEHNLVTVDLNTRRAVELPDFMRRIQI